MSKHFYKIAEGVDVAPLMSELVSQPELWDVDNERITSNMPHYQTHDIWLRYNDKRPFIEKGSFVGFNDPHIPIWYPAINALPSAKKLIFDLMAKVDGEMLGGVLLYNVPAGKEILIHTDTGWHAEYFEKFNINIQSQPGCEFYYPDANEAMTSNTGDVYWFRNTVPHGVRNNSDKDQIILTACIKTFRGT